MLPYNIHHVAIAVSDLDTAIDSFAGQYGFEVLSRERIEDQGVEEAMIAVGGSHLQLLQPLDEMSPVGRFLSRNGEGMHHVAFTVTDIEAALEHLKTMGVELVDDAPRIGGGGHKIAFVHPRALVGTLFELVEVEVTDRNGERENGERENG
jgi:methylmalonyl-CoA/ethylmalonyl-CoA epimerase